MMLRGSANSYPAEVEAAVTAHPKARSSVVVGLPDPEFGQRLHAIRELADAADAQSVADGMGGRQRVAIALGSPIISRINQPHSRICAPGERPAPPAAEHL